jgi:hypothetical protein
MVGKENQRAKVNFFLIIKRNTELCFEPSILKCMTALQTYPDPSNSYKDISDM